MGNTCNWIKRKSLHKHAVNHESNKGHNDKKSRIFRENGGWDNWEMVLIENFSCENDLQARSKEREWLEKLGATMNSCSPIRTREEIIIQHIEYNNNNREIINKKNLERNGTKITCPCGVTLTLGNILKHRKSKKHIAWEKDQEFVDRLEKEMNELIEKNLQ